MSKKQNGILNEDVLKHFGEGRLSNGYYSGRTLFQEKDELPTDRKLLMNARAEGRNAEALTAYQKKVRSLEALERKLQRQMDALEAEKEGERIATP